MLPARWKGVVLNTIINNVSDFVTFKDGIHLMSFYSSRNLSLVPLQALATFMKHQVIIFPMFYHKLFSHSLSFYLVFLFSYLFWGFFFYRQRC